MKIKDLLFTFKWLLAAKSIGLEANNIYDKELECYVCLENREVQPVVHNIIEHCHIHQKCRYLSSDIL
jgi:hypothetical protein